MSCDTYRRRQAMHCYAQERRSRHMPQLPPSFRVVLPSRARWIGMPLSDCLYQINLMPRSLNRARPPTFADSISVASPYYWGQSAMLGFQKCGNLTPNRPTPEWCLGKHEPASTGRPRCRLARSTPVQPRQYRGWETARTATGPNRCIRSVRPPPPNEIAQQQRVPGERCTPEPLHARAFCWNRPVRFVLLDWHATSHGPPECLDQFGHPGRKLLQNRRSRLRPVVAR